MSLTLLGHAADLSLGSSVSTLCHPTHCVMGASATSTYINYLKALSMLYEFIHSFTPFFFFYSFLSITIGMQILSGQKVYPFHSPSYPRLVLKTHCPHKCNVRRAFFVLLHFLSVHFDTI